MENRTLNGIGCFAKPEKLSRIFLRLVQSYTLGQLDGLKIAELVKSEGNKGAGLLQALIAGKAAGRKPSLLDHRPKCENKIITGFYLSLEDHGLQLSIFSKCDTGRERHSTKLTEFTRLRRNRLN